jgi:O-antigen/teichoic acid export membrane protein
MSNLPEEAFHGIARSFLRGTAVSLVAKWITRLLGFATVIILAHELSPRSFGTVATAFAIAEMIRQIGQMGMLQALVQPDAVSAHDKHTAFWLCVGFNSALSLALVVTSPLIATAFGVPGLTAVLRVFAVYPLLMALTVVPEALLTREMRFDALAIRQIVGSVAGCVVAVTLVFVGAGIWALVAQYLTQASAIVIATTITSGYYPKFSFARKSAHRLLPFGWRVGAVDFLSTVATQGDNLLVGALLGPVALGYYSMAFRLLNTLLESSAGVLAAVTLPIFSRLKNSPEKFKLFLFNSTRAISSVATFIFCLGALASGVVIAWVFGDTWSGAAPVFAALCLGAVPSAITFIDRSVLYAAGRPDLELYQLLLIALLTLGVVVLCAPFGLMAVAVAVAGRMYVSVAIRIFTLKRVVSMTALQYVRQFAGSWLAGIAMLLMWQVAVHAAHFSEAAALCFALAAYVLVLGVAQRNYLVPLWSVLRSSASPAKYPPERLLGPEDRSSTLQASRPKSPPIGAGGKYSSVERRAPGSPDE